MLCQITYVEAASSKIPVGVSKIGPAFKVILFLVPRPKSGLQAAYRVAPCRMEQFS